MKCKAPNHPSWLSIHYVDTLVARTVPTDLERRDHVAKMLFELRLRPECEPAYAGMQSIRTDHKIEVALTSTFELNLHTACRLMKADNLVVENDFCGAFDLLEQQSREVAASERHITPSRQFTEDTGPKAGYRLTSVAHDPQPAHVISDAVDLLRQTHTFGNVVSKTPEVDDVAAGTKGRGTLNQSWLKPGCS